MCYDSTRTTSPSARGQKGRILEILRQGNESAYGLASKTGFPTPSIRRAISELNAEGTRVVRSGRYYRLG